MVRIALFYTELLTRNGNSSFSYFRCDAFWLYFLSNYRYDYHDKSQHRFYDYLSRRDCPCRMELWRQCHHPVKRAVISYPCPCDNIDDSDGSRRKDYRFRCDRNHFYCRILNLQQYVPQDAAKKNRSEG